MTTQQYIDNLNKRFQTGISREHAYRGDLQVLLEKMLPEILVTNEPARIACGAPDYILTKKDIPVGYIEAKDVGIDLNSKSLKEQFERYKASLSNLIFTDYLDFHFYRDAQFVVSIRIAEIVDGKIVGLPKNYTQFEELIKDFALTISQSIKSPSKLAEMMAGKARLLANVIEVAVTSDEENQENSMLKQQFSAFQDVLVHDITHKAFADMYAQTIAYGLFAARYHDPTLPTFSREEAATLIPHSNPFLRKLFQSIAGYDLDTRIVWIVDDLIQIFLASDVSEIMHNFGRSTKQEDPIIHFYEHFLASYDPSLRKARGVWYTPEPVVKFIVRAVDEILKTDFNLPQGLADTSKTKVKVELQGKKIEKEIHKVQVLDPATGTGTFLAEVINHIHSKFKNQQGIWNKYVENDLIPRLNGFELLMTSYAMAHLKMDILLTETGFTNPNKKRFKIFLTNSLEEAHENQFNLFTQWLSQEANEANEIKKDTPVMCVIGNPPYSVSSNNKSPWIESLTADYKKDLNERNIQPLSDDYIKFIRFGQHYIDKNGEGVLAYISNNSFIDGIIHRQMRKHLLESFDKVYILDLHGNAKKKEVCLDGSADQNVFDIMQGVSINIFVKKGKKKKNTLAEIFHYDLQGKREAKYDFLNKNSLSSISWNELEPSEPNFFLVKKDDTGVEEYEKGFKLDELFTQNSSGVETRKDNLVISKDLSVLKNVIIDFENLDIKELSVKYQIDDGSRDWKLAWAKEDIKTNNPKILETTYKPFDNRKIIYTGKTKGINGYPMFANFKHFINGKNVGLCLMKKTVNTSDFKSVYITNTLMDKNLYGFQTYAFPLYLYPNSTSQQSLLETNERTPNLNFKIIAQIEKSLDLTFVNEKTSEVKTFAPIDVLDYIYSVLHSPTYRETYKEFLKIDFPRVPYPSDAKKFWDLVELGKQIREIHLLESPLTENYITGYPEDGDNIVTKPRFVSTSLNDRGQVYINETQYFSDVPEIAWNFYIGGYQPAQKWLKDRKERELSYEDILHYQKIIVALAETDRLMKEVDKVGVV
jgi:predicted helicase